MKAVLLCDFDGTAVVPNITVEILDAYAGEAWRGYEEEWLRGERDGAEISRLQFGLVKASVDEIAAFARERADFRLGFHELVEMCRDRGIEIAIATSGLAFYVREALAAGGLPEIEVFGGAIESDGVPLRVTDGVRPAGCPNGGTCKCAVIRDYRARGYHVAFAGDGSRDFCAAPQADLLFARRKLKEFAEREALPHRPFEDFFQVAEELASWLSEAAPPSSEPHARELQPTHRPGR